MVPVVRRSMPVRVEIESENGTGSTTASVRIYDESGNLHTVVRGYVQPKKGWDGGWYPCVELRKAQINPLTGEEI